MIITNDCFTSPTIRGYRFTKILHVSFWEGISKPPDEKTASWILSNRFSKNESIISLLSKLSTWTIYLMPSARLNFFSHKIVTRTPLCIWFLIKKKKKKLKNGIAWFAYLILVHNAFSTSILLMYSPIIEIPKVSKIDMIAL